MAQRLKTEIREQIEAAALACFAETGLSGARMGDIAQKAGISTGNIYRYVDSKEALFYQVIDDQLVADIRQMLWGRSETAITSPTGSYGDMLVLNPQQRDFVTRHRLAVVIVLTRCEGTRHAGVFDDLVALLTRQAEAWAQKHGRGKLNPQSRKTVSLIYRHYLLEIADILLSHDTGDAIAVAMEHLLAYHLAGMGALLG